MDSAQARPKAPGTGQPRVRAGLIRMGPLAPVPSLLAASGVDVDEMLAGYGLTVEDFGRPENVMSYDAGGKLLAQAVELTRIPHFGLLVGQEGQLSTLGTVGYLMRSAPDLGTALGDLGKYMHIHDGGAVVTLEIDSGYAALGYSILSPNIEGSDQILDLSMAFGFNFLRELCGRDWRITAVNLSRSPPPDPGPYRRCFGLTPAFNAESTSLVFPVELLGRPLLSADPVLHGLMAERAAEGALNDDQDIVGRLKRMLRPIVAGPDCTVNIVAKRVGMPTRTLNRRLAAAGTTFRDLRNEVRLEAARQLLRYTRKPAYQIAGTLGFSDASAFTRAFTRRFGMGPAAWREASRRQSEDT